MKKKPFGLAGPAFAGVLLLALAPPSSAGPISLDPGEILVRLVSETTQRVIGDGKWGFVGRLQASINESADVCGVAPVAQDGVFGRTTAMAARAIAQCKGAPVDEEALHLTTVTFQAVTGEAAPDALQRARLLTQTLEATDYDRLEWNVCTRFKGDQGSVLTWGPHGKTLGWGGELLQVLKSVDRDVLEAAFEAEGARGLDQLLALKTRRQLKVESRHFYPGAAGLMVKLCGQKGQMAAWERAFARLGAIPEVRRAYDEQAWGDDAWFRYVVERLSRSWREAGLEPTEVDFAFFLDRSIHMGWGEPRFDAVDAALARLKAEVPPEAFTSARARFAVADAVRPRAHPEDRMARDAIFLVDAEDELAEAMAASPTWPRAWRTSWRLRANIAASDVGLSDAYLAPEWDDRPVEALPIAGAGAEGVSGVSGE